MLLLPAGLLAGAAGPSLGHGGQRRDAGIRTLGDTAFYAAIPVAFVLRDPGAVVPVASLLSSFAFHRIVSRAFQASAERTGIEDLAQNLRLLVAGARIAGRFIVALIFGLMALQPGWTGFLASGLAGQAFMAAVTRATLATWFFTGTPDEGHDHAAETGRPPAGNARPSGKAPPLGEG
jgi:hypothetical protein